MLSSVWNFVKRHKKKFVFTGVLVGGIYYLGKYARRKIIEQQEQEALEFIENMRKQQHYENSQKTCEKTIISMLPNLCEALCKQLNTEHLLVELKSRPDMKIATWEKIKLLSFVRMIASVYSCCLLVLFFKVQLNVLAGCMFSSAKKSNNNNNNYNFSNYNYNGNNNCDFGAGKINSNVQRRYMQCIQLLFKTVLKRIIADVTAAVSEVIGGLNLKTPMTLSTLNELLTLVRRKVEVKVQNGYHDTDLTGFVDYMCSIVKNVDDDDDDGSGGGVGGGGGGEINTDDGDEEGRGVKKYDGGDDELRAVGYYVDLDGNDQKKKGDDEEEENDGGGGEELDDRLVVMRLKMETLKIIQSKSFGTLTTICLDGLFVQLLSCIAGHFVPMNTTTSTNTNSTATTTTTAATAATTTTTTTAPSFLLIASPSLPTSSASTPLMTSSYLCSPLSSSSSSSSSKVMSKPLAKVIPIVNGLVYLVTGNQPNKFVDGLLRNAHVQCFTFELFNEMTNTTI